LREASPGLKASDRIEYGDIREERWQQFYERNSPIKDAARITVVLPVYSSGLILLPFLRALG
jgi:hypothetical protein